jgi:cytochrome c553
MEDLLPKAQAACHLWARSKKQAAVRCVAACFLALAGSMTFGHAADVELGRYLSSECMTCHGNARAGDTIPDIFGLAETTFAEVVKGYRDKRMSNQVMQQIAGRLSDEEIAALAAYFAKARKNQ